MIGVFEFFIGLTIASFAVPTAGFALIALFEGFPKIKLGQIAGIVAVLAWVFALFSVGPWQTGPLFVLILAVLLLIFFNLWKREFRLLMLRGDDEFPGRFDKLGWFLMLTLAAPAGVWLFRSFRQARWPESSGAGRWADRDSAVKGRPRSNPWDGDEIDAPSPARAGVV